MYNSYQVELTALQVESCKGCFRCWVLFYTFTTLLIHLNSRCDDKCLYICIMNVSTKKYKINILNVLVKTLCIYFV